MPQFEVLTVLSRRQIVSAIAALGLLAVLVAGVLALRQVDTGAEVPVPQARVDSACAMVFTSTLQAGSGRLCDPVTVNTSITASCPACPDGMNVVIIQEDTPHAEWQRKVSQQVLDELILYARGGRIVSVGVLHYNGQGVRTALRPTVNLGAARGPLNNFNVAHDPRGMFREAAQEGVRMIRDGRRLHNNVAAPECEFVVFFVYTKVYMADKGQEMIQAGRTLLREVKNLYVGCPHQHPEECTIWEPQVPASERYYTEDPEPSKLRGMVREFFRNIEDNGVVQLRTLSIEQTLPLSLEIVPGSFNVAPNSIVRDNEQAKLTWSWRGPKPGKVITLTYQAEAKQEGDWHSHLRAWVTDNQNRRAERKANTAAIHLVDESCIPETATPVPSATPEPSATPTDRPTATAQPSATTLPSPTPTRVPGPIYLPLLVGEQCELGFVHADVVLVLDISTSMSRPARTGRSKLVATQDAAKAFVSLMDLAPGGQGDQVAVVGFNRAAWIQAPLGTDVRGINQAIDDLALRQAEHTRLDLALKVGAEALRVPNRRTANTPVMILLTDGLPNQVPLAEDGTMETTVLRAAAAAKAAGITVYTIAIGAPLDTNPVLLQASATSPNHYYYTPDPEDLGHIYQAIAYSFGCPPDAFWSRR